MSTPLRKFHYFDTNVFWKFYRAEEGDLLTRRLVANSDAQILVSPLTLLEFIDVLLQYYRRGALKRKDVRAIAKRVRRDTARGNSHRPFRLLMLTEEAFREAQSILLEHACNYSFGSNDALHLGIILRSQEVNGVHFVTCDRSLQRAAQHRRVAWYDPEKDCVG